MRAGETFLKVMLAVALAWIAGVTVNLAIQSYKGQAQHATNRH